MAKKDHNRKTPARRKLFGEQLDLFSRENQIQLDVQARKKEELKLEPGKPFENFEDDLPWEKNINR